MESLPEHSWTRRFDAADPDPSVHTFTRPPVLEVLGLLPIAYRVGTYVNTERSNGRDPIFDLAGIALQPPNPGPHAGAPLGGLGGGSIGRGFRGEFRRWSLTPGRYVHRTVVADAFSLRVQRGDQTWSVVLSVHPPSISSPLASWDWSLPRSCATYHALFPRSWTVYESPVPDVIVVVKQLSPFLPHSYSEASLPCAVFEVEVTNTHPTLAAEVSVMFTFQNGSGGEEDEDGGFAHASFKAEGGTRGAEGYAAGVCLARHTTVPAKHSAGIPVTPDISAPVVSSSSAETTSATTDDSDGDSSPLPSDSPLPRNNEPWSCQCSFSIASTTVPLDDYTEAEVDQGVGLDLGPRAGAGTGAGTGGCSPLSPKLTEVGLEEVQLSTCSQFITDFTPRSFSLADLLARCRAGSGGTEEAEGVDAFQYLQESGMGDSARQLWSSFHATGNIAESQFSGAYSSPDVSVPGTKVGAAVCLRQWLGPACGGEGAASSRKSFPFSLSWDNPHVKFGGQESAPLPRYYTRFVGTSGLNSPLIALFALWRARQWESRVKVWQAQTLDRAEEADKKAGLDEESAGARAGAKAGAGAGAKTHGEAGTWAGTEASSSAQADCYRHMLFNELYYLVDGGSVWTDSSGGVANSDSCNDSGSSVCGACVGTKASSTLAAGPVGVGATSRELRAHLASLSMALLPPLAQRMKIHDRAAQQSSGKQSLVGQFLYLEGHEYLMYNTYDVHFYASFALLQLWPQLELSLQRDFAAAVAAHDPTQRVMMGSGEMRPRKVVGAVPHDLGSPSESPWARTNAYNFQDVSSWKDLGPKFVLQVFRDYVYLRRNGQEQGAAGVGVGKEPEHAPSEVFLSDLYPALLQVMRSTELFDTDGDGMIENSGFPDQTYDIWTAKGVHAYCGGLWVAACEAMACAASLQRDEPSRSHYCALAARSRAVYVSRLWNGRYLDYDSSGAAHSCSIMADMLAGQWYARACALPPLVTPQMALSCFRSIYAHNVIQFGEGRFKGAVNGMKPPRYVDDSHMRNRNNRTSNGKSYCGSGACDEDDDGGLGAGLNGPGFGVASLSMPIDVVLADLAVASVGRVDSCCMQSREVWTGTTYAVAAAMVQEALHCDSGTDAGVGAVAGADTVVRGLEEGARGVVDETDVHGPLSPAQRRELLLMSRNTARGIHDAGWQEYGYWFATPEGWESSGNYRSLGYMRPLCIWAIQFAKEQQLT